MPSPCFAPEGCLGKSERSWWWKNSLPVVRVAGGGCAGGGGCTRVEAAHGAGWLISGPSEEVLGRWGSEKESHVMTQVVLV
jgi:hypothetical protein